VFEKPVGVERDRFTHGVTREPLADEWVRFDSTIDHPVDRLGKFSQVREVALQRATLVQFASTASVS
jgi:hypothetical protein